MRRPSAAAALLVGALLGGGVPAAGQAPLSLDDVLASIEATYPPLLGALIQRDVAEGRLRSARSLYDLDVFAKLKATPDGYYEYTTVEAGAEQFLGIWGTTLYGGYRLTTGEPLPDYYAQRTQGDGEASLGLRIPLLRGGAVDPARVDVRRADLDARAVDPAIVRQRLDFVRAGTVAYLKWVAAGQKLALARELLRLADDRTAALEEQVAGGLRADIVLVDNRRLVVAREIAVIDAERDFQGAALALSLFHRSADGSPVTPGEDRLPAGLRSAVTGEKPPFGADAETGVAEALARRPELVRLALEVEAAELQVDLARNGRLPTLDATLEAARNYGEDLYSDRSATELRAGVEFKLPVQRRQAGGKIAEARGTLDQLRRTVQFARETIAAEVRDAVAALEAAARQTERAALNVQLALELQAAEEALFRAGSSDLLALQIREQAAFDARVRAVEAELDLLTALADYRAAVAEGPPSP